MYVELDTSQSARKQVDVDIATLKAEVNRLSSEKMTFLEQLKQFMAENESQLRQLQLQQVLNAEQSGKMEKLRTEKEAVNKELVETKMRTAREKEELAARLEQIEKDIVRRERELCAKQYEQVLMQSCEAVRADEARRYAALNDQIKQKYDSLLIYITLSKIPIKIVRNFNNYRHYFLV